MHKVKEVITATAIGTIASIIIGGLIFYGTAQSAISRNDRDHVSYEEKIDIQQKDISDVRFNLATACATQAAMADSIKNIQRGVDRLIAIELARGQHDDSHRQDNQTP